MYKLNGKNLAVARLIPRGKNAESRLKYLHASAKGTAVISPSVVARVSLPGTVSGGSQQQTAAIWSAEELDPIIAKTFPESDELTMMPEGRPAVSGPEFLVPKIDDLLPTPSDQTAAFTVNAETLLKVMKVACEVTEDANKTVRLRFCPDKGCLRVDTYRQPGEQEFVAVIKSIEYNGDNIPGDPTSDEPSKPEVKPKQTGLVLKTNTGRKFRG